MHKFRKAILTVLLFVVVAGVFSGLLMTPYFRGENYYYQDIRERDEVSGTLDFLISGTSHSMGALVPDILDEDLDVCSYNLSFPNATMEARYKILSQEIERNPVDTVVIALSYDSLTNTRDNRGYEGYYYLLSKLKLCDRIPYFFKVIKPSEYVSLYYDYLNDGYECLKKLINGTWTNVNEKSEKGFSTYNDGNPPEEWMSVDYSADYNTQYFSHTIDDESVEYLNKIFDLCEENDIQVFLYTVTLSDTLVCKYQDLDVFREWYEQLAKERGVSYVDFNLYKGRYELFEDKYDYNDEIHFNVQGAEKFSELFAEIYSDIQNGEDVSGLFYDSYEELESHAFYTAADDD